MADQWSELEAEARECIRRSDGWAGWMSLDPIAVLALLAAAREGAAFRKATESLDCNCNEDEKCDRCWLLGEVEHAALAGKGEG